MTLGINTLGFSVETLIFLKSVLRRRNPLRRTGYDGYFIPGSLPRRPYIPSNERHGSLTVPNLLGKHSNALP